MFKRKVKKDKRWKALKELDTMSDEDLLELERNLYIKSGVVTGSGLFLFILCIVILVILFNE